MIGSSCSSDEMEFNSLLKPMSLKEMDLWNNYNYEVSLLAQAIQDPDKLIDFLGNAYSEEKRKSLMLSITIAMKDSEYPPKKINKTLPNLRKKCRTNRKPSRLKQFRSAHSCLR